MNRNEMRARGLAPRQLIWVAAAALMTTLFAPHSAFAEPLSSASFQLLIGHPVSAGDGALEFSAGSNLGSTGYSLGQLSVTGFAGASTSLSTAANGFWPIVLGSFPNIDPDGDGIASPFDTDDDGDGLLDVVETGSGVFVSASDTGTSPVNPDTDGDGFDDATEVAAGSDPNDSGITPSAAGVPLLDAMGLMLLVGLLAWIGIASRRMEMETS